MSLSERIRPGVEVAPWVIDEIKALEQERDALRARIERMEKQKPVAQVGVHKTGGNAGIAWSARPLNDFDSLPLLREGDRLYLAPGAQTQGERNEELQRRVG